MVTIGGLMCTGRLAPCAHASKATGCRCNVFKGPHACVRGVLPGNGRGWLLRYGTRQGGVTAAGRERCEHALCRPIVILTIVNLLSNARRTGYKQTLTGEITCACVTKAVLVPGLRSTLQD